MGAVPQETLTITRPAASHEQQAEAKIGPARSTIVANLMRESDRDRPGTWANLRARVENTGGSYQWVTDQVNPKHRVIRNMGGDPELNTGFKQADEQMNLMLEELFRLNVLLETGAQPT